MPGARLEQRLDSAFVLGASGYSGRALVAEFRRAGARVVAHVRADSARLPVLQPAFTALGASVDSTPVERTVLAARLGELRPRWVLLCLGTTRARARREAGASYQTIDLELACSALDACRASGAAPRLLYLSAQGASIRAASEYLRVRGQVEQHLRESGLPWIALRLAFLTGPDRQERRFAERSAAWALDGALAVAKLLGARHLHARWSSIDAATLARGCVRLCRSVEPGCGSAGLILGCESLR